MPALAAAPVAFFDEVLPAFRFTGEVWAVDEGEIVFAHEPLVRVTAPAAEAQLVETALLATITFQTSVASKASRVVSAAAGRSVIEFGSAGRTVWKPRAWRRARRTWRGAPRHRTSKPDAVSACRSPARWRTHG